MLVPAITLSPVNLPHGFYFHGATIRVSIAIIDHRCAQPVHAANNKKKLYKLDLYHHEKLRDKVRYKNLFH